MNVLDLFSGIGGFSLGLERAGMRTVAFCEIEPFCRRVLAKHWPDVPCYDDVRTLTAARLAADGVGAIDLICGGFPCQDISFAGAGAGLAGERSGLWSEITRLAGELRPQYLIVENVAALLSRGLGVVLGDLAALGFDAEWHCIPASALGAPHRRDRVWIVAYASCGGDGRDGERQARQELACPASADVADTISDGHGCFDRFGEDRRAAPSGEGKGHQRERLWSFAGRGGASLADAASERCGEEGQFRRDEQTQWIARGGETLAHADIIGRRQVVQSVAERTPREGPSGSLEHAGIPGGWRWWATEPAVGRVADGVPNRVDRLRALGNAVVPQIPEAIGRAILESEGLIA